MATLLRRPDLGLTSNPQSSGTWARYVNLVAGIWLFISGLLWTQPSAPRLNALVVGILVAAAAVWALWVEEARFVNSALAVWLLFSTLAIFELNGVPFWNDLVVSLIVFGVSLIPNDAGTPTSTRSVRGF